MTRIAALTAPAKQRGAKAGADSARVKLGSNFKQFGKKRQL